MIKRNFVDRAKKTVLLLYKTTPPHLEYCCGNHRLLIRFLSKKFTNFLKLKNSYKNSLSARVDMAFQ